MKDEFYTLGGCHFWEDVFFYQKWRIQRNSISKQCRLLDNWDIRRCEGSFEECRDSFFKYIEAYEIMRQKGHMVILIHSLGQSKNIFKPLWRRLLSEKYAVAAVNYPSSQKRIAGHVKQFHFFLNHLEDIDTISFVTLGSGQAILHKLFETHESWQDKFKLGRAVEVSPYTFGSCLFEKCVKNSVLNFVLGPSCQDLTPQESLQIPPLCNMETGLILAGRSYFEHLLQFCTLSREASHSNDEFKQQSGAIEAIRYISWSNNPFKDQKMNELIVSFLSRGHF
jgi:hypothetical protein